jgi:hypothetical protein
MPPEYALPGDCWPNEAQTWLLRAALLTGRPGREAWETWRARCPDLVAIDGGSKRLLPLLYDNLRAQHIDDPLVEQLKAEFRMTWYKNQATFHRMTTLLLTLQAAGIPTLILKGAALAVLHYKSLGERPMADFDATPLGGRCHAGDRVRAGCDRLGAVGGAGRRHALE